MTNEMPAEALSDLQTQAASGNEVAKSVLAELGTPAEPVKTPDGQSTGESGPNPSEAEAKPTESSEEKVDGDRERDGKRGKKPTWEQTVRELRADRRELKNRLAIAEQAQQKIQALEAKLASLQNPATKPAETEEDELAKLLGKPREYLTERDRKIVEQVQKLMDERFSKLPEILGKRNEASDAFNSLKGMKGFDIERDEDELIDIMFEHGLMDESGKLLVPPMTAAKMGKTLWEKRTSLPPETIADKGAAASGGASATKSGLGKKPSLEELNRRVAEGNLQPDSAEFKQILSEIGAFSR